MIKLTTGKSKNEILVNPSNIAYISTVKSGLSKIYFNFSKGGSMVTLTVYEKQHEIREKTAKFFFKK